MQPCPHCPKSFKSLNQHITKSHSSQYRFVFNKDTIQVFRNGELFADKFVHVGDGNNSNGWAIIYHSDRYALWLNPDTQKVMLNSVDDDNHYIYMKSYVVEMSDEFKDEVLEDWKMN